MEEPIAYKELPESGFLDKMADILDNRFRFPGTDVRFGVDAIIGLIPYVGDVITYIISAVLVVVMARRGASGMLVLKMVWNIFVDGAVGTVPFLGDIFDFRFRANRKNVELMQEYYAQGQHQGSAWWVLVLLVFLLLGLIALSVYVIWRIFYWIIT